MSDTKMNKVIFKAEYSREFPDPLNKNIHEGDNYNIKHHVLICKALDVPSGVPDTPNPREQNIDRGIYKKILASLQNTQDASFHLKNKGITLFAQKVEYTEDKRVVTVYLGAKDGIADGGHTYEIILRAQSTGSCPPDQYVKIEVITGLPDTMTVDIAGGLNTAVQVQDASLDNLKGDFQWIKDELKGMPYEDDIAYMQNDDKEFDIRDIISFLTLFNVEHPDVKGRHPKEAYVSKSKCLHLYEKDMESYKRLRPILRDILYLHDYVHIQGRELYDKKTGGKAAGIVALYDHKKKKPYHKYIFMGAESDCRLYDGILYPILGAMRYLVEIKPGGKSYSWKLKSFKDVLGLFDNIAADLVTKSRNTAEFYGRKPNPVGKDDNHWDNLYDKVKTEYVISRQ